MTKEEREKHHSEIRKIVVPIGFEDLGKIGSIFKFSHPLVPRTIFDFSSVSPEEVVRHIYNEGVKEGTRFQQSKILNALGVR